MGFLSVAWLVSLLVRSSVTVSPRRRSGKIEVINRILACLLPLCQILLFSNMSIVLRPHGTIKHIHSSHLSFCSRLAIRNHCRNLQPQPQLCNHSGRILQSQLATLVASRPSQMNIYSRPIWSDFLIPSCIFYLHANYTTVSNSISNTLCRLRSP
jgi:hypothetical protein